MKFALYAVIWLICNAFLRVAIGLRVSGARRLPRRGPVLVVANHLHNLDPVVLSAALRRPVFYMAKRELFDIPLLRWIMTNFGGYPITRGTADRAALRHTVALLDEGLVVGLFPEGTRSVTGILGPAQPGVGLIALQSGAPILPVAITGTEVLPFDRKAAKRAWRGWPRVRVRVGTPFTPPPRRPGEKRDPEAVTRRIMDEIAALLPPAYTSALRAAGVDEAKS